MRLPLDHQAMVVIETAAAVRVAVGTAVASGSGGCTGGAGGGGCAVGDGGVGQATDTPPDANVDPVAYCQPEASVGQRALPSPVLMMRTLSGVNV